MNRGTMSGYNREVMNRRGMSRYNREKEVHTKDFIMSIQSTFKACLHTETAYLEWFKIVTSLLQNWHKIR